MAEDRLSPVLACVALAKADIPHRMMSKWHKACPTATLGLLGDCPSEPLGPSQSAHNLSSGLLNNKLKLGNSLVLRMLSQHVHSFGHTKKSGSYFGVQGWLVCKFILKNIPCEVKTLGGGWKWGLCESLSLGQSRLILSALAPRTLFPLGTWGQDGCEPKKSGGAIRVGSRRGRAAIGQLWSR